MTGTVSITVDGVPTNYNYVCRPMLFTSYFMRARTDYIPAWGFSISGDNADPQFSSNITGNNIADVNSSPTGPYVATNTPAIASSAPVTYGSKSRTVTFSWSPSRGNIAGGVRTVCLSGCDPGGGSQSHLFQVQYDPKLPKDSNHVMSLPFVLSMGNK